MFKSIKISFTIALFFLISACNESKNPSVSLLSPLANSHYNYGDTVFIKATTSDIQDIDHIRFRIYEGTTANVYWNSSSGFVKNSSGNYELNDQWIVNTIDTTEYKFEEVIDVVDGSKKGSTFSLFINN